MTTESSSTIGVFGHCFANSNQAHRIASALVRCYAAKGISRAGALDRIAAYRRIGVLDRAQAAVTLAAIHNIHYRTADR